LSKKKGFTLIELLVVIAIIALLAAILFPVFGRARENARKATCQSNLKQIGLAMQMYSQDYDGFFPLWYNSSGTDGVNKSWVDVLAPYANAKGKYDNSKRPWYKSTVFDCPSLEEYSASSAAPADYLYFAVLYGYSSCLENELVRIPKPSEVGIVADGEIYSQVTYANNGKVGTLGVVDSTSPLRNRHSEGLNILYCDGHVKWRRALIGNSLADEFNAKAHL
jgi:prepilin-type N-terminal cleavage/methylation domain-containing protein/prepilin-type processing-associated H-X9-DG protein